MNGYVGTLAWSRETGGVLRWRDKVELVCLAGLVGLHLPALALYRVNLRPWMGAKPMGNVPRKCPEETAATTAYAHLADIAAPYLLNHCLRTYWLSRYIAATTRSDFDDELLFVASLAHDVGLLDPTGPQTDQYPCFALRGARWAMEIARGAGWEETRIERLGDTVTLNLNGTVQRRRGVEARLMMLGVLAEVTGIHRWRVDPMTVRGLYTEFPVLDQDPRLATLFAAEANRHGDCRVHFAQRLGFGLLMKHAPRVAVDQPEAP
jgi:hypothetical protein